MKTTITITLTTDTNNKPQAKDFVAAMLTEISDCAVKYGVSEMTYGGPNGKYEIKKVEA